jgi:hypothetical protein
MRGKDRRERDKIARERKTDGGKGQTGHRWEGQYREAGAGAEAMTTTTLAVSPAHVDSTRMGSTSSSTVILITTQKEREW